MSLSRRTIRELGGMWVGVVATMLAVSRPTIAAEHEVAYIGSTGVVDVLDTDTDQVIKRIGVRGTVTASRGGTWIIHNTTNASVELIDPTTGEVAVNIPVINEYGDAVLGPGKDDNTAYMLAPGGMYTLDLRNYSATLVPDAPTQADRILVTTQEHPTEGFVVRTGGRSTFAEVGIFQPGSMDNVIKSRIGPPASFGELALSPNEDRLYAAERFSDSIYVMNARDARVQTYIPTDPQPDQIAISADGTLAYVTHREGGLSVVDIAARSTIDRTPLPHPPGRIALNHDRTKLYILHPNDCAVSVVDLATHTVVRTISVGTRPSSIDVVAAPSARVPTPTPESVQSTSRADSSGVCAYVTSSGDRLTVVDANAETVLGRIQFPRPSRVQFSTDGTRAFVTHMINYAGTGTVAVIDTSTNRTLDELIVGAEPLAFALGSTADDVLVSPFVPVCSTFYDINVVSGLIQNRGDCTLCSPTSEDRLRVIDLVKSLDGGRAYVIYSGGEGQNALSLIDRATGSEITRIPLAEQAGRAALSNDGSRLFIVLTTERSASLGVIDTTTNELSRQIRIPSTELSAQAYALAVQPNGPNVAVGYSGNSFSPGSNHVAGVAIVDTNTNEVRVDIPIAADPTALAFTPDGRFVYATTSGSLVIIDLSNSVVVNSLPIPLNPQDIAIANVPGGCAVPPPLCRGDCNRDQDVSVDELLIGVGQVLGNFLAPCDAFKEDDGIGFVTVDDLISGVNNALTGCSP